MTPLTIGIDGRELLGDRTGVGRYLGELMRRWTAREDTAARRFILYTPEPLSLEYPNHLVTVHVVPGGRGTAWEQLRLPGAIRRDGPDVFFAPAYTAPLRLAMPFAVTIHDVSFSRHPEWFRRREGFRRRSLTRSAARRAAVVLTVSEFSRTEIHELYGVSKERIVVISNGITSRQRPPQGARERLVLYVGSIFNRRHVPDLIAAFAAATSRVPDARLVIVGDNRTWPRQNLEAVASSHGVASRVTFLRHVSDEELASLYARASVCAFLSEYEGFGLTPLEGLSAGAPAVVLDTPVAREIYGNAAEFVPAGDLASAADVIARLLTSREAANATLAHAPSVLARYSWDRAADETLAHLERIAAR